MLLETTSTPGGLLFHFRSTWELPAPLDPVWNTVGAADTWPMWWRSIEHVNILRGPTLPVTVGARAEYRVHSPLGYHLMFQSEVTHVAPGVSIDTLIDGQLSGSGRWEFGHSGEITHATLHWNVAVRRPLLARLALFGPIRSAMSWAHDRVMESGERGLRELLTHRNSGLGT